MRHIDLDREDTRIKDFVRRLLSDSQGSILELEGEAVIKVFPVSEEPVDETKLAAAILERRNESRATSQEWENVDREMWDSISDSEEDR